MTPEQLTALQGYTSAVAMYVAGDGNYTRLKLAAELLEKAFGMALPGSAQKPKSGLPDLL